MVRRVVTCPTVLFWAASLFVLGGSVAPHIVLGDDVPKGDGAIPAFRRVHVHRTWAEPGMESDPKKGTSVFGHVEVVGLRWQSLTVGLRLRTPDGKAVRVAAAAPRGYSDRKGLFGMWMRAPVNEDRLEWKDLRASFPHETVLGPPPGQPRRVIATFRVSSGGLSSVSEAEITVPPAPGSGATRAVRLLAVDVFPNRPPPRNTSKQAGPATEAGRATPARKELGLLVWGYVEAVGLDRAKMVARCGLSHEPGRPIVWKDPRTGNKKPLESSAELDVAADQAQIFEHFIPYGSLGLQGGKHEVTLSYSASCSGLTASMEEQYVIPVPTGSF